MKVSPILHKDTYSALIERPINEWFAEVIYDPLLAIIEAAGVDPDPADQGGQGNLNAKVDWIPFEASLGVPREFMPQITEANRAEVLAYLETLRIPTRTRVACCSSLFPTQSHYSPEKVEAAKRRLGNDRPILVARDLRILDGHHHWLAMLDRDPAADIDIIEFDERITPLITHAKIALSHVFENAKTSATAEALERGRVWYANGAFTGDISARVARELRAAGATYSTTQRAFLLPESKLPNDLKAAAVASAGRSSAVHDQVGRVLDQMQQNIGKAPLGVTTAGAAARIAQDLQAQFRHTLDQVKNIEESVEIPTAVAQVSVSADVTPAIARALNEQLTENLNLYITRFVQEEIPELRRRVQENAFAGGRADRMARIIETSYGVSKRKAAFLAEQETSLLVSKFREQRYREIGSPSYTWSTSRDERVRPDHRALDGKIFSFDSPPITNRSTGARNNPGEDFRCRCVAIPVLVFPRA